MFYHKHMESEKSEKERKMDLEALLECTKCKTHDEEAVLVDVEFYRDGDGDQYRYESIVTNWPRDGKFIVCPKCGSDDYDVL